MILLIFDKISLTNTYQIMRIILTIAFAFFYISSSLQSQNLITSEYLGERTQAALTSQLGPFIQNGVKLYKITYTTPDVMGQLDTASGLFIVPQRDQVTIYPTLVYNHGTVDGPQDVPSNLAGGYELALFFGGLGYATLAPDFIGAGESRGFHPYVHADTEASAGADMVRAVRAYAPEMDVLLNDQLFLTGYSQGGHASMALHRYIETEAAEEFNMTAAAHLSGPYSISKVMLELILDDTPYYFVAYLANTFLSFNTAYDIYDGLEHVFKPEYTDVIQEFYDGEIGLGDLNNQLITQLTTTFGAPITRNLMQDSIVAILEDPITYSDHPLHQSLRDNDVYNWAPQLPTRLFYCMADDQVNYRNAIIADSVMQTLNAVDVDLTDVNTNADHGGCVVPAITNTLIFFAGMAEWSTVTDTENLLNTNIEIYPTPTRNNLFINGLESPAKAMLFAANGQEVLSTNLNEFDNELNLQALPNGVYFLSLRNDSGQIIRKVVIEK